MKKFLWQQISSPIISEIFCNTKFDGVVLDLEHGNFNTNDITNCILTITNKRKKCYVRFGDFYSDKSLVKMCMDLNCDGLIFSTVEERDQVNDIIDFCMYPPKGKRGQGLVRENKWGEEKLGKNKLDLILQIETKKGVDNLYCLTNDLIKYYFIGMYDLSSSLGIRGEFDNELFKEYIKQIEEEIPKEKRAIHLVKKEQIKQINKYKDYGIAALGMDSMFLIEGLDKIKEI